MAGRILLIIRELTGSAFITLIVFGVTALSASAALSFDIIGDNFNSYINKNFASSIPPDTIRVSPKPGKGLFIFSSKAKKLDNSAVKKISGIKGVKGVDPVLSVNVPCQGRISFFTFAYSTDLVCAGVPYSMIKKDLKTSGMRKLWLNHEPSQEIPVLVPLPLIESYNSGLAGANGLPALSPEALKGFTMNLLVGHSSVTSLDGYFSTSGRVSGTTSALSIMGLIIPLRTAKYINRRFGKEDSYMSANIRLKDHGYTRRVKKKIEKMGFTASTGGNLSGEIVKLKRTVNGFIYSMTILVSLLALICTALCCVTAVWGRLEYYRILRMLGASKRFIGFTIIFRFALTGFIAGICSLALLEALSPMLSESLKLPGMKFAFTVSTAAGWKILAASSLLPALSCIPAIVRMFTAKLNTN